MANYGFITLDRKITAADLSEKIAGAIASTIGPPWVIQRMWKDDRGDLWFVALPDTATTDPKEAAKRCQAPGDNVGFLIELHPPRKGKSTIAFRHCLNMFESWAQGCLEEELSILYGKGILYDATDRLTKPGEREYSAHKDFKSYLTRNFDKPLSKEDEAYLERYREITPPGLWKDDTLPCVCAAPGYVATVFRLNGRAWNTNWLGSITIQKCSTSRHCAARERQSHLSRILGVRVDGGL